jgi:phosphoadenosine phosphosulfate reductase
VQQHYGLKLTLYYPDTAAIETYTREQGINAFYESVELRKQCCFIRKVEPLKRALRGKRAWITGLRAQQATTREGLSVQVFDADNGLEKFNPLVEWSEREVWAYIRTHEVPYNALHDRFYPSIGCAPCTRAISPGEDIRAGRWWWENPDSKECGLHVGRPSSHPSSRP